MTEPKHPSVGSGDERSDEQTWAAPSMPSSVTPPPPFPSQPAQRSQPSRLEAYPAPQAAVPAPSAPEIPAAPKKRGALPTVLIVLASLVVGAGITWAALTIMNHRADRITASAKEASTTPSEAPATPQQAPAPTASAPAPAPSPSEDPEPPNQATGPGACPAETVEILSGKTSEFTVRICSGSDGYTYVGGNQANGFIDLPATLSNDGFDADNGGTTYRIDAKGLHVSPEGGDPWTQVWRSGDLSTFD